MLSLSRPWGSVEARLVEWAEAGSHAPPDEATQEDLVLREIGFLGDSGLSESADKYYLEKHVIGNKEQAAALLAEALKQHTAVNTFCGALWGRGKIPMDGAVSLARRLGGSDDTASIRRSFELLNRAGLLTYNRNQRSLQVTYNPNELTNPGDELARELRTGHVVAPDTPYSNLRAIQKMIRASNDYIRWYEPHFDRKVLEVLHDEVEGDLVARIYLLSGPANITDKLKRAYDRFKGEMKSVRGVVTEWRILDKKAAQKIHDRFFITGGFSRNMPPLNSILKGSTGEILPSDIAASDFDKWWQEGAPLGQFQP